MKKIIAIFCCLLLAVSFSGAYASAIPFDNPEGRNEAFPPDNAPGNGINIVIDGKATKLDFDPSEEFSSIANGMVQASFYAYGPNSEYLYEMFLVFPENIASGASITNEYAIQNNLPDCSVVLMISTNTLEQYFFSGQMQGAAYPANTSYTMTFTSVSRDVNGWTYTGSLTASLAEIDLLTGQVVDTIQLPDAPFSFTMPVSGSGSSDDPQPSIPAPGLLPTPTPAAKLDFRKV